MKELNIFRRDCSSIQDVSDEIQTSIYFIKDNLQTFIENFIYLFLMKEYFG